MSAAATDIFLLMLVNLLPCGDRGGLDRIIAGKLECPRHLHSVDALRADLAFLDAAIAAVAVCRLQAYGR
jgi:hypothetical protein